MFGMVIVTSNGSNPAVSLLGIDKVKLSTELSVEPELFASKTVRDAPLATFSNERLLPVRDYVAKSNLPRKDEILFIIDKDENDLDLKENLGVRLVSMSSKT